jgi:methylated-DNA-protein-cysteine methyltransferase related protein
MIFEQLVWQIIHQIPSGQVATYGQIAKLAGYPNHARAVGRVLKHLPSDTTLAWHRVINAQGKITFAFDSVPYQTQRALLSSEEITFINEKISLKTYGWLNQD